MSRVDLAGISLTAILAIVLPVPNVAGADASAVASGPVLEIDDPVFDWKTAYAGERFEHTFILRNTGDAPLTIKEIKTQCGCTAVQEDFKNKTLKPGEKTSFAVNVDTTKFDDFTQKSADVICEGEVQGDMKLWVKGFVKKLLLVHPAPARLELVRDANAIKSSKTIVRLTSNIDTPIRIKSIEAEKKLVRASVEEVTPGKTFTAEIHPTLDASNRAAFHNETLNVAVDVGTRVVEIALPLDIQVKSRIDVAPSKSVWIPRAETRGFKEKTAAAPVKTLEIKSLAGKDHTFKIKSVRVERGAFKATVQTASPGRHYRIRVELLPLGDATGRILRDKIIVETDDVLVPTIKIPVTAQL